MPPPWGQRLGAGTRGLGSRWCCRQVVAEAGTCPPPCLSAWTSVSGLKLASWLFPAAPCPPGPGSWPGQGSCGHPPRSVPVPSLAAPTMPGTSVWRRKQPICFHSESLKIPFWRNEKRKACSPSLACWVPARAQRCAGGQVPAPLPSALPAPTQGRGPGSQGGLRAQRWPGPAHLHEAHTRGPSAKAQLNARVGGGREGAAEISISAAIWREEQARPDKGRGAQGEASVPPH